MSRRASPAGGDFTDVQLVQYLLFRWAQSDTSAQEAKAFYKIGDVDGQFGPRTATALSLFEHSSFSIDPETLLAPSSIFTQDGAVDPMPPGSNFFGPTSKMYKIFGLQTAYFSAESGNKSIEFADDTEIDRTFMGMSVDGQCPSHLGIALASIALPPVVVIPQDDF